MIKYLCIYATEKSRVCVDSRISWAKRCRDGKMNGLRGRARRVADFHPGAARIEVDLTPQSTPFRISGRFTQVTARRRRRAARLSGFRHVSKWPSSRPIKPGTTLTRADASALPRVPRVPQDPEIPWKRKRARGGGGGGGGQVGARGASGDA